MTSLQLARMVVRHRLGLARTRILCSRPFLALHILMGKPVIYRAKVCCFDLRDQPKIRVVESTIDARRHSSEWRMP